MRFIIITTFAAAALIFFWFAYKLKKAINLPKQKPFIAFLPKYFFKIKFDERYESEKEMAEGLENSMHNLGFEVEQKTDGSIVFRKHPNMDLALKNKIPNPKIVVDLKSLATTVAYGGIIAFDTGDLFKVCTELQKKIDLSLEQNHWSTNEAFDKGKWHIETVEEYGLSEEHAYHHTVYFLHWLIQNNMMNDFFKKEYSKYFDGKYSLKNCLNFYKELPYFVSDILTYEGARFSKDYYVDDYSTDYEDLLLENYESEYHIPYSEDNYLKLKPVIDKKYQQWKSNRVHSAKKGKTDEAINSFNKDKQLWCPRCEQGEVIPAMVRKTGKKIYICEECEALWFHKDTIDSSTFNYFNLYMERQGLKDCWSELEY